MQGVGFRPYVYRLATSLALDGFVLNDARGVLIEAEGASVAIDELLGRLAAEAPPLATVERLSTTELAPGGERGFTIAVSDDAREPAALVAPDTATCGDCLAELADPADRRFRYPFVNCTNCGPRFTIVRGVPYDRALTTMAGFAMCALCRGEYEDPGNRRFHAEPNACPACGPTARLVDSAGQPVGGARGDAVAAAAGALAEGAIVAVKGLGGYHLACRADDERAVATLRSRKHREDKPFALMVESLDVARELVELSPAAQALLESRARPIVLAPRRPGARVAEAVAPRSRELGLMLPYSPLHHLLVAPTRPTFDPHVGLNVGPASESGAGVALVMTSGNVSDEPIVFRDDDALARLEGIADLFLVNDRPIHTRTDDSVLRAGPGDARPLMLRRSRGYVPASLDLPLEAARPLLACGAELKSTFCVAKGRRAWVGHHIGDLRNYETLEAFMEGIEHFERLFAVAPELVAHDLHPDYLSTAYAVEREGVELIAVQHHHAHLAACLAEHGETGPAVGAIYDGTGYGPDGTVWGGELLLGDLAGFTRIGHLSPVRLPGAERAVREPWRMACAWLVAESGEEPVLPPALAGSVEASAWSAVAALALRGFAAPVTTSAGRLFDAVAALCGLPARVNYEGQSAIELEALAEPAERGAYPLPLLEDGQLIVLDARPTVAAVAAGVVAGAAPGIVSARFHNAVADATARACVRAAAHHATETVVLSGGVFQNRLLLARVEDRLERAGLRVLTPARLPPGDGGIAYGQAAVAACADGAAAPHRP